MQNTDENNEVEIDLRQVFSLLLSKAAIIIVTTLIGAMMAFAYTRFMVEPVYQSTTQIHILDKAEDSKTTTYSDLQAGSYLTKDFKVIVTSSPVMEQVIDELKLDLTVKELRSLISVDVIQDTRILTIAVSNTDPYLAKKIADAVREVSKKSISDIMDIESISTVEEGDMPMEPVSPSIPKNTVIGALLFFVVTVAVILIRFFLDDTFKTPDDIERYLGISVLASIPLMEGENARSRSRKRKSEKDRRNRNAKH